MSKADKMAMAKAKAKETTSLATAMDQMNKILCEYVDLPFYSPEPEQRVHDSNQELLNHNDWPYNLISLIKNILGTPCNTPSAPEFSFELSDEAGMHNMTVIRKYQFDLGKALEANKGSPLGPGKEFKPPKSFRKFSVFINYGHKWKPSSRMEVFGH
jgi:hypothetical protein